MTAPARLRLSRAKGWRLPEGAVSVGRPGPWGNPFVVGKHGTRLECVELFERMTSGLLAMTLGQEVFDAQLAYREHATEHLRSLKGKSLACWCSLPKPGEKDVCHAAVLMQWAAEQPDPVPAPPFRAGDSVLHGPTGETWLVAWADPVSERLCWCGWPEGTAELADCTLARAATDEEHHDLLRRLKASGGMRWRGAQRLNGEPREEGVPA